MGLFIKSIALIIAIGMYALGSEPLKFTELGKIDGYWEEIGHTVNGLDSMYKALEVRLLEIKEGKMSAHLISPDTSVCFVNNISIKKGKRDEIVEVQGHFPTMSISGIKKDANFIEIAIVNDSLIAIYSGIKYPDRKIKYTYYYKKIEKKPDWWPHKIGKPSIIKDSLLP